MKRWIVAVMAALAMVASGCAGGEDALHIVALKTGKADAILIHTKHSAVLIDTGEDDDGDKVLEEAARRGITRLDYMIITHYDKDHVGGAAEVLRGIEVGEIIEPGYPKESGEYAAYVNMAEAMKVTRSVPEGNIALGLDRATYEIFMPEKNEYQDENDHSIVVKVSYDGVSALFTGDALDERVAELMEYDISARILKVPHHGSFEKSSRELFGKVAPEYAVIPCSAKNPADGETIAALEELGCKVYTTEEEHIGFSIKGGKVIAP